MDGTFIDDRKIHVGFNQSSFKIWRQVWRKDSQHGKGKSPFSYIDQTNHDS